VTGKTLRKTLFPIRHFHLFFFLLTKFPFADCSPKLEHFSLLPCLLGMSPRPPFPAFKICFGTNPVFLSFTLLGPFGPPPFPYLFVFFAASFRRIERLSDRRFYTFSEAPPSWLPPRLTETATLHRNANYPLNSEFNLLPLDFFFPFERPFLGEITPFLGILYSSLFPRCPLVFLYILPSPFPARRPPWPQNLGLRAFSDMFLRPSPQYLSTPFVVPRFPFPLRAWRPFLVVGFKQTPFSPCKVLL